MKTVKALWKDREIRRLFLPWAALFVVLNLVNTQDGGPNAVSRFLTLRAMSEEATFTIDKRIGATTDWSHTPDDHYYSNKAPGPMLLGFPAFFVIDQIPRVWEKGYRDEHGQRHTPGYFHKTTTSVLNQIVPLLVLLLLILGWMKRQGISTLAQTSFLVSVFFGSTVSMYFNNYSGHAFEAILQLGLLFSLVTGSYAWAGFFSGSALLSDYGFVMQIPAFLFGLWLSLRGRGGIVPALISIAKGATLPGVLWVWYHTAAFGSPFLVANHFQNPIFLDTAQETYNFLGIFKIPSPTVLFELLFGPTRGLLFTQPWILFLLPLSFAPLFRSEVSSTASEAEIGRARLISPVFCGLGLAGLLVLNAAYGGWAGGGAAGPRYLSGIFLCFAFWLAVELDRFPAWLRYVFFGAVGVSVAFRALVYGSTILGPGMPLWPWYMNEYNRPTPYLRAGIFVVLFAATAVWQIKARRPQVQA